MATKLNKMSLDEFKRQKGPEGIGELMNLFNGGSFMQCHVKLREQTGLWIPELVPVFQKLDATLTMKQLPRELRG